ncbi:MAG: hypothetical protein K6T85_03130 [Gorillibacterium sp.]|nr:hypothetical protein [Gorillibacterium sp.]
MGDKGKQLRKAALEIEACVAKLKKAKALLLEARSDQHIPLAITLANLEESYGILCDPVCTPEFFERE